MIWGERSKYANERATTPQKRIFQLTLVCAKAKIIRVKKVNNILLGEAPILDRCHCPEISRDANGLTGITELRFYLMWLD